jgi:hypothetical protein
VGELVGTRMRPKREGIDEESLVPSGSPSPLSMKQFHLSKCTVCTRGGLNNPQAQWENAWDKPLAIICFLDGRF